MSSEQSGDTNKKHGQATWRRRDALMAGAVVVAASQDASMEVLVRSAHAQTGEASRTETPWLSYGGDNASSKYSPIDQVSADNFSDLEIAWT